MTAQQALTQARKRWGRNARIQERRNGTHSVGVIELPPFFMVYGQGPNWVEAFADADRKNQPAQVQP